MSEHPPADEVELFRAKVFKFAEKARRQLEKVELMMVATRQYSPELLKEIQLYRGSIEELLKRR